MALVAVAAFFMLGAALFRAGLGLSYKYAFILNAARNGINTVNSIFWIIFGLAYMLYRERSLTFMEVKSIRYGILSGLLGTFLLREPVTFGKLCGIASGILSILLMLPA